MEKLKAQVSALESELKTLRNKNQMRQINWLKRKIEQFMSKMPEGNYYDSRLGDIFPAGFTGLF